MFTLSGYLSVLQLSEHFVKYVFERSSAMRSHCFSSCYKKKMLFIFKGYLDFRSGFLQLMSLLVRDVEDQVRRVKDCYKTNSITTCHQISLHCSVLLCSIWIYFSVFAGQIVSSSSTFCRNTKVFPQTPLNILAQRDEPFYKTQE